MVVIRNRIITTQDQIRALQSRRAPMVQVQLCACGSEGLLVLDTDQDLT